LVIKILGFGDVQKGYNNGIKFLGIRNMTLAILNF